MSESEAAADASAANDDVSPTRTHSVTAAAAELPGDNDTPLTRWIVQHRIHIFVFVAVFYALAFNGQWRVGRDSSLYRGLGHSLATGHGYHFGAFGSKQIYPGLPVLLAALEKIFGVSDWPVIVMIHLFSLGCLIMTYKLVRLRFAQWVAITVTAATALNGWYLELSNEMLADIPLLFGMMLALYGWERLRIELAIDSRSRHIIKPIVILLIGLAIASLMRPTFWILAIAWVMVCIWGLIAGPHRRFYAICLGILVVVWVVVMAVDPRVQGFNPLAGGYERDARASIRDAGARLAHNVPQMLRYEMAYGIFGQIWVRYVTELINIILILSSLLLLRRNPLWTLIILLTVAVTLLMTPVPRYYVMIFPLMALSWLLLALEIARRVPAKHLELIFLIAIIMLVAPNLARCFKVIAEQRKHTRVVNGPKWKDVAEMSRRIGELVPPGEKVIGPWAPIMSYLSGREVVMSRDIIPWHKRPQIWPLHLQELHIKYAVFPAKLYDDAERQIRFLIDRSVIVPTNRVARVGEEWVLAEIEIAIPPDGKDWRKQPIRQATFTPKTTPAGTTRPSNELLARRRKAMAAKRKAANERKMIAMAKAKKQAKQIRAARLAAAKRAEAKARKKRRDARKAAAATQPAATQPVTKPAAQYHPRGGRRDAVASVVRTGLLTRARDGPRMERYDEGGLAGQSFAFFSDSICFSENFRDPRLIPWQRVPAASQFSLLASSPSQNGHVRHCSGRTS